VKRFYKEVTLEPAEGGTRLLLDGRPVKTPAKHVLEVPAGAFAEAVAEEWASQGEDIDPATMPLTRLANTVIDGVAARAEEVRASLCGYGETDLICHWAEAPQSLVERQAAAWQPVLDWFAARGAAFQPVQGIVAQGQDNSALDKLASEIAALDLFALAALHEMTSLTGSVLLALAAVRGGIEVDAVWEAAHIDERFQIEQWGEDAEARARYESRRAAYDDAVRALRLLGVIS
jgi:chaperone required for assembly of F1-ATPase